MKKISIMVLIICIITATILIIKKINIKNEKTNQIIVSNVEELKQALQNANPGDEIILKEGNYIYTGETPKGRMFYSEKDGNKENPIIIRSESEKKPATISGPNMTNFALWITGDYWTIKDLKITNAEKGIIIDNSEYSKIINCEIYNIGQEGIAIRDNSSNCIVDKCNIHDTGVSNPGSGEGIYVGTFHEISEYGKKCDNNVISNCHIGPNVAAEHIDIKEYTTGTIVENCTFDGTGMSGENYSDSFLNIAGNDVVVKNNIVYRNNCQNINCAFQMDKQIEGWARNAYIYNNKAYMDTSKTKDGKNMYLVGGYDSSATVWGNYMAYESGELFSIDNVNDRWNYYNVKDLTYGQ